MAEYRTALNILCNSILKYASPTRGAAPSIRERRDPDRPTYVPEFFDQVCAARLGLKRGKNPFTEEQSRIFLENLLTKILQEAEARRPHLPAYFELAIDLCQFFKFDSHAEWFCTRLTEQKLWNQIDMVRLEKIGKWYSCKIMAHG
jgi:hypothetical protein